MNNEQIKGNWLIFKGKVKQMWGKLTDDDLNVLDGQLDELAGRLSYRYGIAKQQAHQLLEALLDKET